MCMKAIPPVKSPGTAKKKRRNVQLENMRETTSEHASQGNQNQWVGVGHVRSSNYHRHAKRNSRHETVTYEETSKRVKEISLYSYFFFFFLVFQNPSRSVGVPGLRSSRPATCAQEPRTRRVYVAQQEPGSRHLAANMGPRGA